MATTDTTAIAPGESASPDPTAWQIVSALTISMMFVAVSRLPVARTAAFDFDEVGYLQTIRLADFPIHHTLFLATARLLGDAVGNAYRGFVILDGAVSALALVAIWWWLGSLVGPMRSAVVALVIGCAPLFWSYGAMAANYTAIPLVGSSLLGIAWRGRTTPRGWHPFVAAFVLAVGTGYRQDIGMFWLPVFLVILWQHRWILAAQAAAVFVVINLAWAIPMMRDAGGWAAYRQASAEFAYHAGYMNSIWHLGFIDAPVRYAFKASLAIGWILGPGILFVPRGMLRARRIEGGGFLAAILILSIAPALCSHFLVHFGVPGYSFHYLPALAALLSFGIGQEPRDGESDIGIIPRGLALAAFLAALFLFYPTNYDRPSGWRRDFDLTVGRYTRIGLLTPNPARDPISWRTVNSQELPGDSGRRTRSPRRTLLQLWPR